MRGNVRAMVTERTGTKMWALLRVVIAVILFVAAFGKMLSIVTIIDGNGLLNSRPLLLIVIAL